MGGRGARSASGGGRIRRAARNAVNTVRRWFGRGRK